MAVRAKRSRRSKRRRGKFRIPKIFLKRHLLPGWLMVALVLVLIAPHLLMHTDRMVRRVFRMNMGLVESTLRGTANVVTGVPLRVASAFAPSPIAPLFTPEVDHWARDIRRWSNEYDLDPNLLATVMQIESCGHPTVSSSAGAQGLFQVMPFHFSEGENQIDPNTNAMRGVSFLNVCLDYANGDPGLAMACYNGGPGVLQQTYPNWYPEVQRYYTWGTGIYNDASRSYARSETLNLWLDAGGARLCEMAAAEIGLR